MPDPADLETSFNNTRTGSARSPRAALIERDRANGNVPRWYQASLPPPSRQGPTQLGEESCDHPRQFGEFECGPDGDA